LRLGSTIQSRLSVGILDSLVRRHWDLELGGNPLTPIASIQQRLQRWQDLTGKSIDLFIGDINNTFLKLALHEFEPEAIVHFGAALSSFSMIDREHAVLTQVNNVVGIAVRDARVSQTATSSS